LERSCPDDNDGEPLLTLEEAYRAAYFAYRAAYFVVQYYGRERITPFMLILNSMRLEGKQETSDPAHWNNWLASVQNALTHPDLPGPDAPLDNR
jgi:hypothetical protein